ncbi:MAG: hypothetical protein LBO07_01230 [Coriobacteriales bacterium]|jgi:hypothetical protein|nr:hypothetical protein [Coriobacteriales bacterium]
MRLNMHIALKDPVTAVLQGICFDSCFHVMGMVSLIVGGWGDLEAKMTGAFDELRGFLKEKDMQPITPPFVVVSGDEPLAYAIVKIGYAGIKQRV